LCTPSLLLLAIMPTPAASTAAAAVDPFDASWQRLTQSGLDEAGQALLARAGAWAQPRFGGQTSSHGEPLDQHGAGVTCILAALQTDAVTRAAGLLAALPVTFSSQRDPQPDLAAVFGMELARLVQGAHALVRLGLTTRASPDSASASGVQKEMLRKMLLAMAADLRIVLMRLASRLQTLRWHAASKTPCELDFARESLDLYAPLANRLGVWQLKWELEDLSFRFLEPVRYKTIAGLLEEKRAERERFVADVMRRVSQALADAGIQAEVTGRPKHIYSIWNKMRIKRLNFSQLYDLRAVRVIVPDVRACYTALGLVHALWTPLADEFDDYISRPKPNGYRSLHTVVRDETGRSFEVQIRTQDMHRFAEYGMAAHWRYKEAGAQGGQIAASSDYDRQLSWLRQLLAWNSEVGGERPEAPGEGANGLGDGRIYVLTPQARVVELPAGATPVDFAYHLHTDLGHRCRGAKVDGHMVALHTRLSTGQTVEITAAKARDWLNPNLGFLASPRARAKVRAWFNAVELQQRITHGQALVEKALQRLGRTSVKLEQLAQQLGFARVDDLYVAVAKDEFSLHQIDALFAPAAPPATDATETFLAGGSRTESVTKSGKSGVLVVGVDSLLTQLARCCRPAPPDAIAGFVTRGRGVSIHRADCASFHALARDHAERIIDVAWGETADTLYPVDLDVRASDRPGLLRDLSEVFARLRLNVVGVNTQSRQSLAHMVFTVEVRDGGQLAKALTALRDVSGVLEARRR